MKPKALVLCFTDQRKDVRPKKQINVLKEKFYVTSMGIGGAPEVGESEFLLHKFSHSSRWQKLKKAYSIKFSAWERFYLGASTMASYKELAKNKWDVIIANEVNTLPIAVKLKQEQGAKLVFDAHEYYPLECEGNFTWSFFFKNYLNKLLQDCLPQVDLLISVAENIIQRYISEFGNVNHHLCRNVPSYQTKKPQISKGTIQLFHHGMADPCRNLEKLIDIMKYVNPSAFHLNFLLVVNHSSQIRYLRKLKKYANRLENITFFYAYSEYRTSRFL